MGNLGYKGGDLCECPNCGANHNAGAHHVWKCNNCDKFWCNVCHRPGSWSGSCPYCPSPGGIERFHEIVEHF